MKKLTFVLSLTCLIGAGSVVADQQRIEFITHDSAFKAVIVLADGAPTVGEVSVDWIESFLVRHPDLEYPSNYRITELPTSCTQGVGRGFPPYSVFTPTSFRISSYSDQISGFKEQYYQHNGDDVPLEPPVEQNGWGYEAAFWSNCGRLNWNSIYFGGLLGKTYHGTWHRVEREDRKPSCEVIVEPNWFEVGESVTGTIRLTNPATVPVTVGFKSWTTITDGYTPPSPHPAATNISIINLGNDGTFTLPPGHDQVLGPFTLFTVDAHMYEEVYLWGCRLVDPASGKVKDAHWDRFYINSRL